ncbi:hypothetical protein ElyMa_004594900 [Elysia marginata]|uniref:Uncharacterized protein n=1 Tax=Elysia marginata TaxID=1093978 RepID=A0AAV4HWK0_9GAST|nr:hypothetical protein ElyMa_004594900 [Elysia marginata]
MDQNNRRETLNSDQIRDISWTLEMLSQLQSQGNTSSEVTPSLLFLQQAVSSPSHFNAARFQAAPIPYFPQPLFNGFINGLETNPGTPFIRMPFQNYPAQSPFATSFPGMPQMMIDSTPNVTNLHMGPFPMGGNFPYPIGHPFPFQPNARQGLLENSSLIQASYTPTVNQPLLNEPTPLSKQPTFSVNPYWNTMPIELQSADTNTGKSNISTDNEHLVNHQIRRRDMAQKRKQDSENIPPSRFKARRESSSSSAEHITDSSTLKNVEGKDSQNATKNSQGNASKSILAPQDVSTTYMSSKNKEDRMHAENTTRDPIETRYGQNNPPPLNNFNRPQSPSSINKIFDDPYSKVYPPILPKPNDKAPPISATKPLTTVLSTQAPGPALKPVDASVGHSASSIGAGSHAPYHTTEKHLTKVQMSHTNGMQNSDKNPATDLFFSNNHATIEDTGTYQRKANSSCRTTITEEYRSHVPLRHGDQAPAEHTPGHLKRRDVPDTVKSQPLHITVGHQSRQSPNKHKNSSTSLTRTNSNSDIAKGHPSHPVRNTQFTEILETSRPNLPVTAYSSAINQVSHNTRNDAQPLDRSAGSLPYFGPKVKSQRPNFLSVTSKDKEKQDKSFLSDPNRNYVKSIKHNYMGVTRDSVKEGMCSLEKTKTLDNVNADERVCKLRNRESKSTFDECSVQRNMWHTMTHVLGVNKDTQQDQQTSLNKHTLSNLNQNTETATTDSTGFEMENENSSRIEGNNTKDKTELFQKEPIIQPTRVQQQDFFPSLKNSFYKDISSEDNSDYYNDPGRFILSSTKPERDTAMNTNAAYNMSNSERGLHDSAAKSDISRNEDECQQNKILMKSHENLDLVAISDPSSVDKAQNLPKSLTFLGQQTISVSPVKNSLPIQPMTAEGHMVYDIAKQEHNHYVAQEKNGDSTLSISSQQTISKSRDSVNVSASQQTILKSCGSVDASSSQQTNPKKADIDNSSKNMSHSRQADITLAELLLEFHQFPRSFLDLAKGNKAENAKQTGRKALPIKGLGDKNGGKSEAEITAVSVPKSVSTNQRETEGQTRQTCHTPTAFETTDENRVDTKSTWINGEQNQTNSRERQIRRNEDSEGSQFQLVDNESVHAKSRSSAQNMDIRTAESSDSDFMLPESKPQQTIASPATEQCSEGERAWTSLQDLNPDSDINHSNAGANVEFFDKSTEGRQPRQVNEPGRNDSNREKAAKSETNMKRNGSKRRSNQRKTGSKKKSPKCHDRISNHSYQNQSEENKPQGEDYESDSEFLTTLEQKLDFIVFCIKKLNQEQNAARSNIEPISPTQLRPEEEIPNGSTYISSQSEDIIQVQQQLENQTKQPKLKIPIPRQNNPYEETQNPQRCRCQGETCCCQLFSVPTSPRGSNHKAFSLKANIIKRYQAENKNLEDKPASLVTNTSNCPQTEVKKSSKKQQVLHVAKLERETGGSENVLTTREKEMSAKQKQVHIDKIDLEANKDKNVFDKSTNGHVSQQGSSNVKRWRKKHERWLSSYRQTEPTVSQKTTGSLMSTPQKVQPDETTKKETWGGYCIREEKEYFLKGRQSESVSDNGDSESAKSLNCLSRNRDKIDHSQIKDAPVVLVERLEDTIIKDMIKPRPISPNGTKNALVTLKLENSNVQTRKSDKKMNNKHFRENKIEPKEQPLFSPTTPHSPESPRGPLRLTKISPLEAQTRLQAQTHETDLCNQYSDNSSSPPPLVLPDRFGTPKSPGDQRGPPVLELQVSPKVAGVNRREDKTNPKSRDEASKHLTGALNKTKPATTEPSHGKPIAGWSSHTKSEVAPGVDVTKETRPTDIVTLWKILRRTRKPSPHRFRRRRIPPPPESMLENSLTKTTHQQNKLTVHQYGEKEDKWQPRFDSDLETQIHHNSETKNTFEIVGINNPQKNLQPERLNSLKSCYTKSFGKATKKLPSQNEKIPCESSLYIVNKETPSQFVQNDKQSKYMQHQNCEVKNLETERTLTSSEVDSLDGSDQARISPLSLSLRDQKNADCNTNPTERPERRDHLVFNLNNFTSAICDDSMLEPSREPVFFEFYGETGTEDSEESSPKRLVINESYSESDSSGGTKIQLQVAFRSNEGDTEIQVPPRPMSHYSTD